MAQIRAFRGIRPRPDNVARVVSRPFESYHKADADHILATVPESFLHVVKPEFGQQQQSAANSEVLFKKSKDQFERMVANGILLTESAPALYVYTQHTGSESHTGVLACTSVEDYLTGRIRIHEQTIASRELMLSHYLNVCDINAEPVCLTYPRSEAVSTLIADLRQQPPLFSFSTDDGRAHQLWPVTQPDALIAAFAAIPYLYIADGHHRTASSVLLAQEKAKSGASAEALEPFNWFMSILIPDDQLRIYEFNRVVRDLGPHTATSFLAALSTDFTIDAATHQHPSPTQMGTMSMYLAGQWHMLQYKGQRGTDAVAQLDVSLLADHILTPHLGITDMRRDKRLGFVPGIKGTEELECLVNSGQQAVAFALHPVSGQQFYAIADQGLTMPPKSTYIVPKLLSGLVVYGLGCVRN